MTPAVPSGSFGPVLQAFFLERLVAQRNASPQTVAAYRDSFRLLLQFAQDHRKKAPEALELQDLDAPLVLAFLDHLEHTRHNTIRSRNARFAAIRSFAHFAALKEPTMLPSLQRVLAIPMKRFDKPLLGFLSKEEIQAILDAPPVDRWSGQRDRIMLATLYHTGARVSELTGVQVAMWSSRAVRACGSMAKAAKIAACPCGGPPPHGCASGSRGSINDPTDRSSPARRAAV